MKAVLGPLERTAWNYRPTGPQIWLLPRPPYTPRLPCWEPQNRSLPRPEQTPWDFMVSVVRLGLPLPRVGPALQGFPGPPQ